MTSQIGPAGTLARVHPLGEDHEQRLAQIGAAPLEERPAAYLELHATLLGVLSAEAGNRTA